MSTVRLLVLGVCRLQRRAHGYAVHRQLSEWRVDTWTSVKPGSVYHALKQLTSEGRLVAVGEEPGSRGPGKTVYELTPAGEAEFLERLEGALSSFALDELGAGIALMGALPRARALELLGTQAERSRRTRDGLAAMAPAHPDRAQPPHTQYLLELWAGSIGSTAVFIEGLIDRVEAGEYRFADDAAT